MSSPPKIYSPEYYKLLRDMEERHWWNCGMRDIAASLLAGSHPKRILDAGCGTGVYLDWLQRFAGAVIYGIDISPHALQYCRERGKSNIARASVIDLPFPESTFDLIVCNDVLQHVPSQEKKVLSGLYRVLNKGGLLFLRTNAEQRWAAKADAANDYYRYSLPELQQKAEGHGFHVVRATYANSVLSLLADLRNYRNSRKSSHHHHHDHAQDHEEGYTGLAVQFPPAGLNPVLLQVLRMEAWYLRKARSIRFGHSLIFLLRK